MENNFQMVVNRSLSDGIVTIANGRSSSVTHASTSSVHVTASPLAHDISTRSLANQIQHMNILDCKFANTNNHKVRFLMLYLRFFEISAPNVEKLGIVCLIYSLSNDTIKFPGKN